MNEKKEGRPVDESASGGRELVDGDGTRSNVVYDQCINKLIGHLSKVVSLADHPPLLFSNLGFLEEGLRSKTTRQSSGNYTNVQDTYLLMKK